jgi:peptidyl-prolyl cis-trans isomerase SurA
MSNADFYQGKIILDSIYSEIKNGKISFEDAAKKYSDDNDTKLNGGLMINRNTASTKFSNEDLNMMDQNLVVTLNAMQIGEISKPMQFMNMSDGKPAFRLLKLKNRIDPHTTNLKDDYQKIANMANADYNKKQVKNWIKSKSKITYIKLDPEFICTFENQWTISN